MSQASKITHSDIKTVFLWIISCFSLILTVVSSYLEQQLVFGDSLNWFDEGRGDGVGQAVSPLDLLHTHQKVVTSCVCVCVFT